jgi:hypothetical protein
MPVFSSIEPISAAAIFAVVTVAVVAVVFLATIDIFPLLPSFSIVIKPIFIVVDILDQKDNNMHFSFANTVLDF